MEPMVRQALLFDFYGELLTEHQKDIFGDYIQNDLSPTEIASGRQMTRQAAYDMIRRCNGILDHYESQLHLVEKFLNTRKNVQEIHRISQNILSRNHDKAIRQAIERIESVSSGILEEL